jgi:predicted Zn-dependent protease
MKIKSIIVTCSVLMTLSNCHRNAMTGKSALNLIPEQELITMSKSEYQKFLTEHPPLPASDSRVQMVRNCGERIQKAVEEIYAQKNATNDLNGFEWEFNVVGEEVVNAWCMPGGKVVVYTGLLPVTQDETSLAVVMGHEIAHAIARHGNQRMSQGLLIQYGGATFSAMLGSKPQATQALFNQSFGLVSTLGALKYSRKHETEADKLGLCFAAAAGYNPEAAIAFWERMAAASGGQKPPEILSTHPSDATRIATLKEYMPEAMKYYKPR